MADTGRRYSERLVGYFTPEQKARIEKVAWKRRIPVAEVLRELADTLPIK